MNIKNESGITLVALVVSIIVMLILASVTLNTTFTAYDTTKAEKFKAQMKVLQEGATDAKTEYENWYKEQGEKYKEELREYEFKLEQFQKGISPIKPTEIPETDKLKENGDLPDNFRGKHSLTHYFSDKRANLVSNDKIPGSDISTLTGSTIESLGLDTDKYNSLASDFSVINNETDFKDVVVYKLTPKDVKYYLGVDNIDLKTIYIDFEDLFIFTDNYVKIDKVKIYSQYGLASGASTYSKNTQSTIDNAIIKIDVIANYGTSKKIRLTMDNAASTSNERIEYKIRKAYYKNTNNTHLSEMSKNSVWYEVDDLRECQYSEDGKSVTFVVFESGDYAFKLEDLSGGYTVIMYQDVSVNIMNTLPDYRKIENGYFRITLCNAPVLNADMIPVKWMYTSEERIEGKWVVCTTIDPEWYNYGAPDTKNPEKTNPLWANIMIDTDKFSSKDLKPGVELAETEMGSMFVWVPRFSVENVVGIEYVRFLRGTSNTPTSGQLSTINGQDVQKAFINGDFSEGCWDAQLKGLWFSKYDIGIEELSESEKGQKNTSIPSVGEKYNKIYSSSQSFRAVSKPYRITWRNISLTSAYSQAMMFYDKLTDAHEKKNINSHLMKNSEQLALRILSRNKEFGYGAENIKTNTKNKVSSGSDGVNGYSFQKGYIAQTSTGNITGVYDITGTTTVAMANFGAVENVTANDREFIYDGTMKNLVAYDSSPEDVINNSTKYFTIGKEKNTVLIGERNTLYDDSTVDDAWKSVTQMQDQNIGFRIVIANSPAGDVESYIYESGNLGEVAGENMPGFYVTDNDGNYIRNSSGKFFDASGNKTFYPWSEMLDNGWIKEGDGAILPGNNIAELKAKTGILVVTDNSNITTIGGTILEEYGCFQNWSDSVSGNGNLLEIRMFNNIEDIKSASFSSCRKLKNIRFSKSLKTMGSYAFSRCESLVNYVFPESLEKIGEEAFYECYSLESVIIPKNVQKIERHAFAGCKNIETLNIEKGTNELSIERNAFTSTSSASAPKIKSLIIPSNVIKIGEWAFASCYSLEDVKIENGIKTIDGGAFSYCSSLKEINFPSSIESFAGMDSYYIDETGWTNANFRGMLEGCSSIEVVDLSNLTCMTALQYHFFRYCSSLKEIYLPNNVTTIRRYALQGCSSLEYLKLPSSLNKISGFSFGFSSWTLPEYQNLNIDYMGTQSEWNSVDRAGSWYSKINIIVNTTDRKTIRYDG